MSDKKSSDAISIPTKYGMTVFDHLFTYYLGSLEEFETDINELIEKFRKERDRHPEYSNFQIEIRVDADYDNHVIGIKCSYQRPFTDWELADLAAQEQKTKERELEQYRLLKKKFELDV